MSRDRAWVGVAYGVATLVAVSVAWAVPWQHPLAVTLAADVAATVVVFAFSLRFDNSSFYDPYWSVAPIPIACYWALASPSAGVSVARQLLVLTLVGVWGLRLTSNWVRGWRGLRHEDWRYVDLRAKTGAAYWWVSFGGLHLVPTLIVFLACLPLFPALSTGTRPFGGLDVVAAGVTAAAIWIEARADRELREFRSSAHDSSQLLATGLWGHSRHPNYFGEIGFWFGLLLFGLAASPAAIWVAVGLLAIVLMFRFASLPMIEARMRERRPEFEERMRDTPMLVPRIRRAK